MHTPLLAVKPEERRMSGNICLHGRIREGCYDTDWILYGLGQRKLARGCEYENAPSGMIKCGECLGSLRIKYLITKDYLPSRYLLSQQLTLM